MMEEPRIEQADDGSWQVVVDGRVIKGGLTNSEAWRLADRYAGEAHTPIEHRTDYASRQSANGGKPNDPVSS